MVTVWIPSGRTGMDMVLGSGEPQEESNIISKISSKIHFICDTSSTSTAGPPSPPGEGLGYGPLRHGFAVPPPPEGEASGGCNPPLLMEAMLGFVNGLQAVV
jgi:hypothetical protein